jgi:hypothetical protein
MPFPFLWIGAVTAGLFLGAVFGMFGLALRLVTRTSSGVRSTVLPGLVSGFRDWASGGPDGHEPSRPVSPVIGPTIEDAADDTATPTEPLQRV